MIYEIARPFAYHFYEAAGTRKDFAEYDAGKMLL